MQRPTSKAGGVVFKLIGCSKLKVEGSMFRRLIAPVIFALLLLSGGAVWAQDAGGVAGSVVSSWDGSPLSFATVTVRGTTLAAQTDVTGRYELKGVPAGTQVLRFSKAGFSPVTVTDVIRQVVITDTATEGVTVVPSVGEIADSPDKQMANAVGRLARSVRDQGRR